MTERSRRGTVEWLVPALLVAVLACAPDPTTMGEATPAPTSGTSMADPRQPASTRGPTAGGVASEATPPPRPITWKACGSGAACGTLRVLRDPADPGGGELDLAVARRPATGPGARIGTLFYNPGGPGAAGVDYVKVAPLDPGLNERFDIVSWDPRGVGGSAPVDCDDHTLAYRALDWSPDDASEQEALEAKAAEIASGCEAHNRGTLASVGTDATARDLDALRVALGDEQVTFIGFSYGTYLGLRYAELFPTRVRAMVLDGVVDPTQDLEALLAGQTEGLERHMDELFASCRAPACPLTDAAATYDRVAENVESAPLEAGSDAVGPTALAFAAISASYQSEGRALLFEALEAAEAGNGRPLMSLASQYWESGSFASYLAILCADTPRPVGAQAHRALADHLRAISPRFGDAMANEVLACAFWKTPNPPAPRAPVRAQGSAPILVVGNSGDVATPLESARQVASDLDDGVLLTYAGQGHTSFRKSRCVDDVIGSYLTDLTTPEPSKSC